MTAVERTRRRVRRARLTSAVAVASAAALLGLGLAACGSTEPEVPAQAGVAVSAPLPVGASDPAPSPTGTAAAQGSCDPRSSLRPGAAGQPGPKRAEVLRRGRLIVGVDQNTYLFGFRDPFTGQLTGFDIDIAHEMARAILGDPNKIQFRTISSAQRIPAIQNNEVDLVVRTMTMTCDRWQQVSFSTEYFTAGQRVLVQRDSTARSLADLRGRKVCATTGSTSLRAIWAAKPQVLPVSVVDWTDCLVMLQQGQVEAISTDDAILAGLAAQDPNTKVVGPRITAEPYGIAMPKDDEDLVRFVNGVLERLREDGTWQRIYQRWLTGLGATPSPPAARYRD